MAKAKNHNEWFMLIKKRTCTCGQKKTDVYSWGEYVCGKWRTVDYVCESCFPDVAKRLVNHARDCGCEINLVSRYGGLPEWLKLPETFCKTVP